MAFLGAFLKWKGRAGMAGMPELPEILGDPEVVTAMQDPEVSAAFQKVAWTQQKCENIRATQRL